MYQLHLNLQQKLQLLSPFISQPCQPLPEYQQQYSKHRILKSNVGGICGGRLQVKVSNNGMEGQNRGVYQQPIYFQRGHNSHITQNNSNNLYVKNKLNSEQNSIQIKQQSSHSIKRYTSKINFNYISPNKHSKQLIRNLSINNFSINRKVNNKQQKIERNQIYRNLDQQQRKSKEHLITSINNMESFQRTSLSSLPPHSNLQIQSQSTFHSLPNRSMLSNYIYIMDGQENQITTKKNIEQVDKIDIPHKQNQGQKNNVTNNIDNIEILEKNQQKSQQQKTIKKNTQKTDISIMTLQNDKIKNNQLTLKIPINDQDKQSINKQSPNIHNNNSNSEQLIQSYQSKPNKNTQMIDCHKQQQSNSQPSSRLIQKQQQNPSNDNKQQEQYLPINRIQTMNSQLIQSSHKFIYKKHQQLIQKTNQQQQLYQQINDDIYNDIYTQNQLRICEQNIEIKNLKNIVCIMKLKQNELLCKIQKLIENNRQQITIINNIKNKQ